MNRALRDDNLDKMRYFGSYIKELRDVFKTDHENQLITPFEGKVWRGITFEDPEQALADYPVGVEFVWSAFTSMTTNQDVAKNFGNLTFEIECCPPAGTFDDDVPEYAPANIKDFSSFPGEDEILFPPNISFRVVRIEHPNDQNGLIVPLVCCKVVGFDTDTGIHKFQPLTEPAPHCPKSASAQPSAESMQGAVSCIRQDPPSAGDSLVFKQLEELRARFAEETSYMRTTCSSLEQRVKDLECSLKGQFQKYSMLDARLQEPSAEKLCERVQALESAQSRYAQRFAGILDMDGATNLVTKFELDKKVIVLENQLRASQRSLEQVVEERVSELRRLTMDAESKAKQSDRSARDSIKEQSRVLEKLIRECMEQQRTLEQKHSLSGQNLQSSMSAYSIHLQRIEDRIQEASRVFEDRVRQMQANSQHEINDGIRRAVESLKVFQSKNPAWQNQLLLPGYIGS
jgi:hypothetical protein